MNWILLALLAPLAWSVANYLDKYILSHADNKEEGGSGGLLVLSALVSLLAALAVFIFHGGDVLNLGSQQIGALLLSGMLEAMYILFYFWALEKESTTTVISLFQFAPAMGLLFGYLMLHEVPDASQFFAVGLILIGTLMISHKKGERFSLKGNVFILMLVSTAFVGLYNTLFKLAGENLPFWTGMFWQYIGIGMIGFLLFASIPPYRKQSIDMLTKRSGKMVMFTGLAEGMNILALMATNAALVLAPVALVLSVGSVQPVFVLIEGYLLAAFFPRLFQEEGKTAFTASYLIGILLVCVAGFLIYQ